MKYTIGIIYTGGTIGMNPGESGLTAGGNFRSKFFQQLPHYLAHESLDFIIEEYATPIDSAHADLQFAVQIFKDIKIMSSRVGACLVLMGSDTLSYIAASLAYLLHQSRFPVVVSGAMRPLIAPNTDAISNVDYAIESLLRKDIQGVQVVFGGELISAVRCTKLYTHTHAAMVNTASNRFHNRPLQHLQIPSSQMDIEFRDYDIRVIRAMPGLHKNFVRHTLGGLPDAVLIQCYGSGTAPAEETEFGRALKAAKNAGVPLFAISQPLYSFVDFSAYAASAWLEDLGIVGCGDMNLEASYAKLWYLLNCGFSGENLARAMQVNLCGEISAGDIL